MKNNKLTYISLFSGGGIGCYGFKEQDYECIATNELDINRINIQKINKKCKYDSGYIPGDIRIEKNKQKLFEEIKLWEENEGLENVDVVVATPPCQGMSTANYKKNDEQKRNSLVVEAIKMIKEIKPKVFILENVKAFMNTVCTDIDGRDKLISESIYSNLEMEYNIYHKVINFKDYGVPSSRPRTIVIGTSKKLINVTPLNLFPLKQNEITLRQAIGNLKPLKYGEIDEKDVYHFARKYPEYMEEWIKDLKEGESAFQNSDDKKPYKIVNGERQILKSGHLGNKFRRLFWDKHCACVTTRNDLLASQDTIHPSDNRVLSIRELMNVMTIPNSFSWVEGDKEEIQDKEQFLKKHELNIRRCIGEAVPTQIMKSIAKNIKVLLEFEEFCKEYKKSRIDQYLQNKELLKNFYIRTFLEEEKLNNRKETGSFYTPQIVVYDAIKKYKINNKKNIKILEPAVGLGAFIFQLLRVVDIADSIELDVVDINEDILKMLRTLLSKEIKCKSIKINYICKDFLELDLKDKKYDLIITNPPYGKPSNENLKKYRKIYNEDKLTNIFSFFMKKLYGLSDEIIYIIPKNFLMASEYEEIRKLYENISIVLINDFGVNYFKDAFVEIISIHFKNNYKGKVFIENKRDNCIFIQEQKYIIHDKAWLLYRNEWFDNYINTLKLNYFEFFRDRQITNKYLRAKGNYRVLRSKNILDNGQIISIEGYDRYIDSIEEFNVKKYLNSKSIIMPNFTYNTRATILPDNCIPNGSIAILIPKDGNNNINLELYSTKEFRDYYAIVKNKSKFTINIDSSSIYYIGVRDNDNIRINS